MEKNENEIITLESGVIRSQPSAPSGFSLSRVQEEEKKEEAVIGFWYVCGKGARKYSFPEEYFQKKKEIDEKYERKIERINQIIKKLEKGKENLEDQRYEELRELQAKYLEEAGFELWGR